MESPHEVHIQLLGGFLVSVEGRTVHESEWRLRKTKNLVKLLALAPGHRLHREQVTEILWPDQEPQAGANNLKKAVHVARRALESEVNAGTRSSYLHLQGDFLLLRSPGALVIDVEQFEQAATQARDGGEPRLYEDALRLYTGDLLPEDRYEAWAIARQEELRELHLTLLLELARLQQARGDVDAAIEALKGMVAREPAHEEAQTTLIRLYAESGHRHRALRQYQHLREALHRDLDIEPAEASRRLYEGILAGRFPPSPQATPPPIGSAQHRVGQDGGDHGAVTLVGRDLHLEILEEKLDSLFAGHGGFVLLVGEAGIGKSRLLADVAERVRYRGGIALLGGAYHPEGQLPYGPLMEALEPVGGTVAPGGVREIFDDAVGDLARLTPGSVSAMRADRQRLFASIADLLQGLAATSPVLLGLDDLHDADEASLQLLHYLVRTTRNHSILLLGTFRSEEAPPTSALGQLVGALHRQQWVDQVLLGRLDRRDSEVLVEGLLDNGPVDRAVVETVHRLAAGNPFFTEEVLRALRESGRLQRIEGRWELLGDEVPLESPVLDLLAGRLQRLGPAAAQILSVAAVVGREVPYPLLRAATDLPDSTVLDALDVCLEHRVLEETPEGYRFDHPLQRETVYQRLSGARRMNLHARVAVALEHSHGGRLEDRAESLAYHWAMSEDPDRAVPYLIQAGDRAAAVFASEVAITNYERALDLLHRQDMSDQRQLVQAGLWEKIGDLHALASETAQAEKAYGAAIAALQQESGGEEGRLVRLYRKVAYSALTRHDVTAAASHLAMAEELLSHLTDSIERGRVRLVSALLLWEHGNHADGRAAAEESLELARQHGEVLDLMNAYMTLALVFHSSGEWKEGLQLEIQHVGVAADADAGLGLVFDGHMCLGEYHLYGDTTFEAVEAYARRTVELATRAGARRAQAAAFLLLGESLLLGGRWDEADLWLDRSLDLQRAVGSAAGQIFTLQRMAELCVYRGDHAAAEDLVRQALQVAVDPPMAPHVLIRTYATAALNHLEDGDPKAAAQILDEAATVAARTGYCAPCNAMIHPVATRTYVALGDLPQAEQHAAEAQRVAANWDTDAWRAMADVARATVLQTRGNDAEALRTFLAAAQAFERLGQRFDAARCYLWAGSVPWAAADTVDHRGLVERALRSFQQLGAATAEAEARRRLALL